MNQVRNLIAVVVALLVVGALVWHFSKTEFKDEKTFEFTPSSSYAESYQVQLKHLDKWLQQAPALVASKVLPSDLRKDMSQQCKLLIVIIGLADSNDGQSYFGTRLKALKETYLPPGSTQPHQEKATSEELDYPYFMVPKRTNPLMVDDFRFLIQGATLDNLDYTVNNLNLKLETWREKHALRNKVVTYNKQFLADRGFLRAMPQFIQYWKDLQQAKAQFSKQHPDLEEAKQHWMTFEKNKLPLLNAFIEEHERDSWQLGEQGFIEGTISPKDALYLKVKIAERHLYLPVQPAGNPLLGLSITKSP